MLSGCNATTTVATILGFPGLTNLELVKIVNSRVQAATLSKSQMSHANYVEYADEQRQGLEMKQVIFILVGTSSISGIGQTQWRKVKQMQPI